ncbi:MAG: hypothetical protein WCI72_03930 [archaeon]
MAEIEHYDFPQAPKYASPSASSIYFPAGSAFPGYVQLMASPRQMRSYSMSASTFSPSSGKFNYRA